MSLLHNTLSAWSNSLKILSHCVLSVKHFAVINLSERAFVSPTHHGKGNANT